MTYPPMEWKGKSVVVTGADGFIGSHLAEALTVLGAGVTALVQYNSQGSHGWLDESEIADHMDIQQVDIRDYVQTFNLVHNRDYVFHLAALISVPHSVKAPYSYMETNVIGTQNVATAALGCERFIHTSTSEVYGSSQSDYMSEEHPIVPQSPYAASKVAADALVTAWNRCYGLPVVILRPFNTYGPRQSERAFIPSMIRQALDPNCKAIDVGNVGPIRDFTYIGDTVSAYLALAKTKDSIDDAQVFNGGTGKAISMGKMLKNIVRLTKAGEKHVEITGERIRRAGFEVDRLCSDATKIKDYWEPVVKLDLGLQHTIDWWKKRLNNLRFDTGYQI